MMKIEEKCPEDTVARYGLNEISMRVDELEDELVVVFRRRLVEFDRRQQELIELLRDETRGREGLQVEVNQLRVASLLWGVAALASLAWHMIGVL